MKIERGYAVIFGIFAILVISVICSFVYLAYVTKLNYEIAQLNCSLVSDGIFMAVPQITADMSVFNWAISAESAAFAIVTAAQFRKKRLCNIYEYGEKWIDEWFKDPETRPYITQIIQTWMQNNNTIN